MLQPKIHTRYRPVGMLSSSRLILWYTVLHLATECAALVTNSCRTDSTLGEWSGGVGFVRSRGVCGMWSQWEVQILPWMRREARSVSSETEHEKMLSSFFVLLVIFDHMLESVIVSALGLCTCVCHWAQRAACWHQGGEAIPQLC